MCNVIYHNKHGDRNQVTKFGDHIICLSDIGDYGYRWLAIQALDAATITIRAGARLS